LNRNAVLALMLVLLLPFISYWVVNYYSKTAVDMPKRYFFDGVGSYEKNGKVYPDTNWHRVNSPIFYNQFGKEVSLDDIHNKSIVLNFFFTRCPSICPGLMRSMKKLQESYKKSDSIVQFVSVTVDPLHDSIEVIRKYADKLGINHDNWWILTGDKAAIYEFCLREMKAGLADTEVDTAFIHTENFFLLDSNKVIRGWYNAFDEKKMAKLASDIPLLLLEKNRKSPSIFRKFIPILPLIAMGVAIVIVVVISLQRKRKKYESS